MCFTNERRNLMSRRYSYCVQFKGRDSVSEEFESFRETVEYIKRQGSKVKYQIFFIDNYPSGRGKNYSEERLRNFNCNYCKKCLDCRSISGINKRLCAETKKWGSVAIGYHCMLFEDVRKESSTKEYNGLRIKADQLEDYRTEEEWLEECFVIKKDAKGKLMYPSMSAMNLGITDIYYLPEEVELFPLKNY